MIFNRSPFKKQNHPNRTAARQPNQSRRNRRRTKPQKISDGRKPTLLIQIDPPNLAGLIDLIATIPFQQVDLHPKDILGHDPQSTPPSSSSTFLGDLCVIAVQNSLMAIRSIDFGKEPAETFTRDQNLKR